MKRQTWIRLAVVAALALPLLACFEQPVDERLSLCFLPGGEVVLTVSGDIAGVTTHNPALEQRVAQAREDFASGLRSWDSCFASLEPGAERLEIQKLSGESTRVVRQAVAENPEDLRRFFQLTDVDYSFSFDEGRATLEITPRTSSRATSAERKRVATELASWAGDLSTYLTRATALYRYLQEHPERAEPCLARLFSVAEKAELTKDEAELVDALSKAMSEATRILEVPKTEAFTLEELSRRVYDPFPARFSVSLPSAPQETVGFVVSDGGRLVVPGLSCWEAFLALSHRWVAPDPLLAMVQHARSHGSKSDFPLAAFLAQARRWSEAPPPAELLRALESQLAPAPVYRAVWLLQAPVDIDALGFSWGSLPCPAVW
jgi:hypothetical protein